MRIARSAGIAAVILGILIASTLALAQTGSGDEESVQSLLLGSLDCRAPCWMGVEVGVTRRDDAAQLLRSHPWVARVVVTDTAVIWRWNGQQPALINGAQDGLFKVTNGIVKQVRIQTNIPFGEVWLLLSRPDHTLLVRPLSRYSAFQIAGYADPGIQVISSISCPIDPAGFWWATITLGMGEIWTTEALNGRTFDIYDQSGWWRSLRHCSVIGN